MLRDHSYPRLDRFRLVAAFLIVAIHISPLSSLDATADFVLTRIIARVGVPFFLMTSGFFLLPAYLTGQATNYRPLKRFWGKTGLLYATAVLLYLPVNLYAGQLESGSQLLQDLVFNGTFYHLWYLPGAMLGLGIVVLLSRWLRPRPLLAATGLLYAIGLLGDSYYGLSQQIPALADFYSLLFQYCQYTRNGLFFTPLFLALGGWLGSQSQLPSRRASGWGLAIASICLVAEGLLLHQAAWQRHDSMYIALVPVMYLLFQLLLGKTGPGNPELRQRSMLIYLLHPLCLILVRGSAKLVGLEWLFIDQSLVRYIAVCALSALLAYGVMALDRRSKQPSPQDRAWLEIDLNNLAHNARVLQQLLPPGRAMMAVVKADAYGHGSGPVVRALTKCGVRAFAVATLREAIALRRQHRKGEILILGYTPPREAPLLHRYRLTQTLVDHDHAAALAAQGYKLQVHIKVDTGMSRLGESSQHPDFIRRMFRYPNLEVTGIYTHLCAADSPHQQDIAFTQRQIKSFYQLLDQLTAWGVPLPKTHIQSSYGLVNYPNTRGDYVRPGIALYGARSSQSNLWRRPLDLKPVLSLKARVSEVKDLEPGQTVGYGRCFTATKPMRIAALAIGYGDGIPRNLQGGRVLLKGASAPILGRICMDILMVDVTTIPEVAPDDIATLIGTDCWQRIPAEEMADQAGTITNQLFCGFGNRLPRVYLES